MCVIRIPNGFKDARSVGMMQINKPEQNINAELIWKVIKGDKCVIINIVIAHTGNKGLPNTPRINTQERKIATYSQQNNI